MVDFQSDSAMLIFHYLYSLPQPPEKFKMMNRFKNNREKSFNLDKLETLINHCPYSCIKNHNNDSKEVKLKRYRIKGITFVLNSNYRAPEIVSKERAYIVFSNLEITLKSDF